jgi:hypothetical protein
VATKSVAVHLLQCLQNTFLSLLENLVGESIVGTDEVNLGSGATFDFEIKFLTS